MKLSELASEIEGAHIEGGDPEIGGLCVDSRVAGAGDLFFCFRGTHTDSHVFAPDVEKRGVAALLCERKTETTPPALIVPDAREAMARVSAAFFHHPEKKMKFVGVTGTNGKTTVTHMLESILRAGGEKTGLIGTLGAHYASARVAPSLTTPDPVFLFSLLADMAKAGVKTVALEVSAHALALRKELPIYYDVAVFTNLTQDHLDFFKTMQAYGDAKRKLFTKERCAFAVINADDPFSHGLCKGTPYLTYGMENPADSFAMTGAEGINGTHAVLNLSDELVETVIPLLGRHNVYNALAAATAARKLGAELYDIAAGLEATRVEGRLERVASYNGAEIVVDFAHTPDGLEKSLAALRKYCKGRLIVLFGCGGNRDKGKRPMMGETAARLADFAVLTSDNPRFEEPAEIISEIEEGFRPISKKYAIIEDREKATEYAIDLLEEGDVLLVAGKGGECEQEIMGIKYSYSDKTVIKTILGISQ